MLKHVTSFKVMLLALFHPPNKHPENVVVLLFLLWNTLRCEGAMWYALPLSEISSEIFKSNRDESSVGKRPHRCPCPQPPLAVSHAGRSREALPAAASVFCHTLTLLLLPLLGLWKVVRGGEHVFCSHVASDIRGTPSPPLTSLN